MKNVMAVVFLLTIFGCGTTTEDAQSDVTVPEVTASVAPPINKIPVVLIEGGNSSITYRETNAHPPMQVAVDDIPAVIERNAAAIPTMIAIDPSRLRESAYLTAPEFKDVKKQTGVEKKPNPALKEARDAVRKAEADLRAIETSDQTVHQQGNEVAGNSNVSGWGIAALAGAMFASKLGLSSAKKALEDAKATLEETKPVIDEPVYTTVTLPVATKVVEKSGEISAYVIDTASQTARAVRIPVKQESRTPFHYDPANDPRKAIRSVSPATHEVSVTNILALSAASPAVPLADMVSAVKKEREGFDGVASVLERKYSQATSATLAQLKKMTNGGDEEMDEETDEEAAADTEEVDALAANTDKPVQGNSKPKTGECAVLDSEARNDLSANHPEVFAALVKRCK